MSYILASSKPVIKPTADYEKLKTKLRNSTTGYGTAIVASYFITQGAAEGVSATVGVASSLAYLSSLTKYVDELEFPSPGSDSYTRGYGYLRIHVE